MIQISRVITPFCVLAFAALVGLFVVNRPVAEKVITELAMPVGLVWIASALAMIVAGLQRQRLLFALATLIWLTLFVAGNSYLAICFAGTLERPYLDDNPLQRDPMEAVVVLGGASSVGANGLTRLGWHGDRIMLAVRLYRRGLVDRIVCTGSRIPALDRNGMDPKDSAAELCIEAGVPAERVERVDGINTQREMKQLGERLPPGGRVGLITSAFHMPRAMRLAQQQGLEFVPLPADFVTPANLSPNLLDLIPDSDSIVVTRMICKEYLARIVGR